MIYGNKEVGKKLTDKDRMVARENDEAAFLKARRIQEERIENVRRKGLSKEI